MFCLPFFREFNVFSIEKHFGPLQRMSRMTKRVSKTGKVDPGDRVTLPVNICFLKVSIDFEQTKYLLKRTTNSSGAKLTHFSSAEYELYQKQYFAWYINFKEAM